LRGRDRERDIRTGLKNILHWRPKSEEYSLCTLQLPVGDGDISLEKTKALAFTSKARRMQNNSTMRERPSGHFEEFGTM